MIRLGIVGLSPGNGHPYSFSAIVNGYRSDAITAAGWDVIARYLDARSPGEIGLPQAQVTHVWAQSPEVSAGIQAACYVDHAVEEIDDFIGKVDAVIIARDDYENHYDMAKSLLEAGLPVFVDKPLSLDLKELRFFEPYLRRAKLMSCSGFYFARELDGVRSRLQEGEPPPVYLSATVINGWAKYGIHMVEAACSLLPSEPLEVTSVPFLEESFVIRMSDGAVVQINALGNVVKTFDLSIVGKGSSERFTLTDNFSAFKRTLIAFIRMVETGRNPSPQTTP